MLLSSKKYILHVYHADNTSSVILLFSVSKLNRLRNLLRAAYQLNA
jgi:hypothetical protein